MDAYIVGGVRTAIGKFRGSLAPVRTDDLLAHVIKALLQRYPSVPPSEVDDVVIGCANQAGEDNRNVARMALLLAGLPYTVSGETVNRLCASGLSSVVHAARAIAIGDGDVFIAGGVEHMTRGPWVLSKASQPFGNDSQLYDSSFGWRFINPKMEALYGTESMGQTAENLVDIYEISRQEQDRFAYHSQMKAVRAQESGRLAEEIVPITIPRRKEEPLLFKDDEFIKPHTTLEVLATLRPAFRPNGTVTAGNASGLNDGAAALLVVSQRALERYHLRPLARVAASAVVGVEPRIMGIGPVYATRKLLQKTGLTLDDIDIIEINEAFAAQVLACLKELELSPDDERINPNGGAIALGHPLGMTGARLALTAALQLQHTPNARRALVTMCIGVGQGYAVLLEKP